MFHINFNFIISFIVFSWKTWLKGTKGSLIPGWIFPILFSIHFTGIGLDSINKSSYKFFYNDINSLASSNWLDKLREQIWEIYFGTMFAATEITPRPPFNIKELNVGSSPEKIEKFFCSPIDWDILKSSDSLSELSSASLIPTMFWWWASLNTVSGLRSQAVRDGTL